MKSFLRFYIAIQALFILTGIAVWFLYSKNFGFGFIGLSALLGIGWYLLTTKALSKLGSLGLVIK